MESVLNPSAQDAVRKAANDAQKIGKEFKSEFDRAMGKSKDAASDLGENLRGAAEAAAASGRELADEYMKRGRREFAKTSERVSAYADDKTLVVTLGAFAAGIFVGYLASRR